MANTTGSTKTHLCASGHRPSLHRGSSCRRGTRHPESSAWPAAGPLPAVLPQLEHCGHRPVEQLGRRPWSRVVGTAGKLAKNFQEIVFEFEVSQKKRKVSKEWLFYNRAARGFITSLIMRVPGNSNDNAGPRRRDIPMLKFMCWLSTEHVMFLGVVVQRIPCQPYHANPGSLVV